MLKYSNPLAFTPSTYKSSEERVIISLILAAVAEDTAVLSPISGLVATICLASAVPYQCAIPVCHVTACMRHNVSLAPQFTRHTVNCISRDSGSSAYSSYLCIQSLCLALSMQQPSSSFCLVLPHPTNKIVATSWKGFQVHLPDFKLDNSKFKVWEGDPYHICGSKARFGVYKALNEYSESDHLTSFGQELT
jgi:hypothetical protein